MGSYIKTILILIVLVVLVTFGIKNNETMILQYYFQLSSMPVPVYAVVYVSLLVGIFIGMIVGISARFTQRKKIKELQKENRTLKDKATEPQAEEPTAEKKANVEAEASMDETQVIHNRSEDEEEGKEADV
ncbi:MAG: LapA family protein [Desulfobulbia bacterium]